MVKVFWKMTKWPKSCNFLITLGIFYSMCSWTLQCYFTSYHWIYYFNKNLQIVGCLRFTRVAKTKQNQKVREKHLYLFPFPALVQNKHVKERL